jgi:hypothetical protein
MCAALGGMFYWQSREDGNELHRLYLTPMAVDDAEALTCVSHTGFRLSSGLGGNWRVEYRRGNSMLYCLQLSARAQPIL